MAGAVSVVADMAGNVRAADAIDTGSAGRVVIVESITRRGVSLR